MTFEEYNWKVFYRFVFPDKLWLFNEQLLTEFGMIEKVDQTFDFFKQPLALNLFSSTFDGPTYTPRIKNSKLALELSIESRD